MYFDGSLMKTGAGAGLLFISPLGVHVRYIIRLHFAASNNAAEYEALINGLQIAIELGVRRLDVWGDSQLVIDQVMKDSNCHDRKMEAYCKLVRRLEDKFDGLELNHIARKFNEATDELAKMASARALVPPEHIRQRPAQALGGLCLGNTRGPTGRATHRAQGPLYYRDPGGRARGHGNRCRASRSRRGGGLAGTPP